MGAENGGSGGRGYGGVGRALCAAANPKDVVGGLVQGVANIVAGARSNGQGSMPYAGNGIQLHSAEYDRPMYPSQGNAAPGAMPQTLRPYPGNAGAGHQTAGVVSQTLQPYPGSANANPNAGYGNGAVRGVGS